MARRSAMDPLSRAFLRQHFPGASAKDWHDWRWQVKHRMRDAESLRRVFTLTPDEEAALARIGDRLPVGLSPYYASRLGADPARHPLRATVIPATAEFTVSPGEYTDPLGEDSALPI